MSCVDNPTTKTNWSINYADHCEIAGNGFIRASRYPPAQFEDARELLNRDFRDWARRESEETDDSACEGCGEEAGLVLTLTSRNQDGEMVEQEEMPVCEECAIKLVTGGRRD